MHIRRSKPKQKNPKPLTRETHIHTRAHSIDKMCKQQNKSTNVLEIFIQKWGGENISVLEFVKQKLREKIVLFQFPIWVSPKVLIRLN